MAFLDQTINWANYAESSEKIAFFKEFVQFFGKDELNCARGILNRKRKREFAGEETAEPPRVWKGPRLFTGCNLPPVRSPSQDVIPPGEVAPVELVEEENPEEEDWTEAFEKKDFVAFDVEAASRYVKFLGENGKMFTPFDKPPPKGATAFEKEPRIPKAAYVAVVDFKRDVIYEETVQHLPGTYHVDYWSKTTANITSTNQLKHGKPFQNVVSEFLDSVNGKYVITCGGGSVFRYLEISPVSLRQFDLQSYYQRPSKQDPEKNEAMGLRDIYFYHFREDFQRGLHDAATDAKATMKCFMEGYCKLDRNKDHKFSEVPNLKQLAMKGLFYCKLEDKFRPRCSCEPCNNVVV